MADKELIQAFLRGTLLHRIWGLWLSPLPLHCTELRREQEVIGGTRREHTEALSVGDEDSGKGMRSNEGQAVTNLSLSSTGKPALGGSDLSVLGGTSPSDKQPSHVCRAVTQQV